MFPASGRLFVSLVPEVRGETFGFLRLDAKNPLTSGRRVSLVGIDFCLDVHRWTPAQLREVPAPGLSLKNAFGESEHLSRFL